MNDRTKVKWKKKKNAQNIIMKTADLKWNEDTHQMYVGKREKMNKTNLTLEYV